MFVSMEGSVEDTGEYSYVVGMGAISWLSRQGRVQTKSAGGKQQFLDGSWIWSLVVFASRAFAEELLWLSASVLRWPILLLPLVRCLR